MTSAAFTPSSIGPIELITLVPPDQDSLERSDKRTGKRMSIGGYNVEDLAETLKSFNS